MPIKIEVSVPEAISLFKDVQKQPKKLFEIIRTDVKETLKSFSLPNLLIQTRLLENPLQPVNFALGNLRQEKEQC